MNKTGTSSINQCFRLLGLTPIAAPSNYDASERKQIRHFYKHKNYSDMLDLAENFRAFEDRPWNMWSMYRHLYQRFPDSRFILTVRDEEAWWRSAERWTTVTKPKVMQLYQSHLRVQHPDKESMIESYLRYNQEVEEYFAGTDRLLVMNIGLGDGWDKLCTFLDVPIPDREFPHANRQKYSEADAELLRKRRKQKHGLECQSCHQLSIIKKKKASSANGRGSQRQFTAQRLKHELSPEKLKNSVPVRKVLYNGHRLLRTLKKPAFELLPARQGLDRLPEGELAVVSCFFNPGGSQRRVSNFLNFLSEIRRSGIRCQVVELAFGSNPFQIVDHEDVIQLRGEHVMWHKEHLLNIGIKKLLSEGLNKIAWLDGDIVFSDPLWAQKISSQLDLVNLCQVFETIQIHDHLAGPPVIAPSSVKYFRETGLLYNQPPTRKRTLLRGMLKGGQSGFGWAARAEVLEQALLYNNAIVGGGDKLIMAASLSEDFSEKGIARLTRSKFSCKACGHKNQSDAFTADYLEWAQRWSQAVDGKVGYAKLQISDMYHGKRSDRGYMVRHDILYRNEYDPSKDLISEESDCLTWSSGKETMHREVENYFLSRRDDV